LKILLWDMQTQWKSKVLLLIILTHMGVVLAGILSIKIDGGMMYEE